MKDSKYCPMAKEYGCLGDKCMFWSSIAEHCMIIDNYLKTLDLNVQIGAIALLTGQTPSYKNAQDASSVAILFERFSTSVRGMLHLLDELSEQQEYSGHYRRKLKKIRKELYLLIELEIGQYS